MITSPENPVVIPADIAEKLNSAIESRQNTATLLDAEIVRLKGLVNSEKYTIGEFNKQKQELLKQIYDLSAQKEGLSTDLSTLAGFIEESNQELDSLKEEVSKLTAEKKYFMDFYTNKKLELSDKEEFLNNVEETHAYREKDLSSKEKSLEEKHKAIKELAAKL